MGRTNLPVSDSHVDQSIGVAQVKLVPIDPIFPDRKCLFCYYFCMKPKGKRKICFSRMDKKRIPEAFFVKLRKTKAFDELDDIVNVPIQALCKLSFGTRTFWSRIDLSMWHQINYKPGYQTIIRP